MKRQMKPTTYLSFALDTLLPLSRDRFADPVHGGFFEQLAADAAPLPLGHKRVMVQCRQLYVLSHAAVLGERSGEAAAERGYAFLRRAYRDTAQGGWFFRAADDGTPTDRHKDLYAHAFVLFALAWLHRAFAAPDAIPLAEETMAVLHARMAAANGGFWDRADADWQPDRTLRRQNPHMHLLEAVLALHAATGDARWRDEAAALTVLFRERFYHSGTATLGEFFAADWSPDPARGHIIEPGHHFEWVWLLHRWQAQGGGLDLRAEADALFAHATRHGFDRDHGGIHDRVGRDGAPLLASRRIWPVTEAIKAHAVRGDAAGTARLIDHLFSDFLRPAATGWIETMTREGVPQQTTLPASTPYHLFLAAAEAADR